MITDKLGLSCAEAAAQASLDPSTQTGCVLVSRGRDRIVSSGYNRFPRGVEPTLERFNDRALKYPMIVHAEVNAILRAGFDTRGCTAYMYPWPPCADCAGIMIEAGIERVVAPEPTKDQISRWGASFEIMKTMFHEAGVTLDLITKED